MEEVYVSVDVETDGPIPGQNSLLSIGAAALVGDKWETFSVNLAEADGACQDEQTMREFWAKHPEAYEATRQNALAPAVAMTQFAEWLRGLPGKPVFVGYPVAFDFMFTHWYFIRYRGHDPFGLSGLDIKTMAMALLKTPFRGTTKRVMPKHWFSDDPHTHIAVDDALEQGKLFHSILAEMRSR